jgi:hypothetical protein
MINKYTNKYTVNKELAFRAYEQFSKSTRRNITQFKMYKKEPGVVVHICNHCYMGVGGRRMDPNLRSTWTKVSKTLSQK